MALEAEKKFYETSRADLLKNHEGKYALIKGERLVGVYDTPDAAFDAGVGQFGNEPMLIKKIERQERIDRIPALVCGWPHA